MLSRHISDQMGPAFLLSPNKRPEQSSDDLQLGLWQSPPKIAEAAILRSKLIGVPYLTDCWITTAIGNSKLESVELTRNNRRWTLECDMLAFGFHLVPNTELVELLGCEIENDFVRVDECQQTTCPNVYCAGEPTGIAGIEAALIEGTIAGLAAAGKASDAEKLFAKRDRAKAFGAQLDETFALRDELRELPRGETIVCRCEDVEFAAAQKFNELSRRKAPNPLRDGPLPGTSLRAGNTIPVRLGAAWCAASYLSG